MNWVAITIAGGTFAWLMLRDRKPSPEIPQLAPAQKTAVATTSSPRAPSTKISSAPSKTPTQNDSPSANTQYYVQHLENAAKNVSELQALLDAGAVTHEDSVAVNEAWEALSFPIDVLTAQKDLNLLGAQPPLVEDGVLGPKTRDAIDSFQRHAELSPTGVMDPATSNALRRAIVFTTSQSQQGAVS